MTRYRVGRRIGCGGMGEVFLAVRESIGGFEKLVVIKRLFRHLVDDPRVLPMFVQEARLAACLQHPNVVQTFDIDRDEFGVYIAMEYHSGETLAKVLNAMRRRSKYVPIDITCRIGASIAAGLHAAHTATDAAGAPQPVVHRDVTPSNLIVGYSGITKIVDFGVAKAVTSDLMTRAGAVKGKRPYLAPEQVEGEPVDARTDVFQLGIVMHEMLTARRLFRGKSDHQMMMAILHQPIAPPSEHNSQVPPELDALVMRALARRRDERPPSAEVFREQLETLLQRRGAVVTSNTIADWMRSEFAAEFSERLQMERDCVAELRGSRDGTAQTQELPSMGGVVLEPTGAGREPSQRTPSPAQTALGRPRRHPSAAVMTRPGMTGDDAAPRSEAEVPRAPTGLRAISTGDELSAATPPKSPLSRLLSTRTRVMAAALLLFAAVAGASALLFDGGSRPPTAVALPTASDPLASSASTASETAMPPALREFSSTHAVADARGPVTRPLREGDVVPADGDADDSPDLASSFPVSIDVEPSSAVIVLDGEVVARGGYTGRLAIDGTKHRLEVRAPGYRTWRSAFTDEPPTESVILEPLREPLAARERTRRSARSSAASAPSATASKKPESPSDEAKDGVEQVAAVKEKKKNGDEEWGRRARIVDNVDPWRGEE